MGVQLIDAGPVARQRARHRAIFLAAASVLIVLAHAVDVVGASGPNWDALVIRLVWAALLLFNATVLLRGGWRAVQVVSAATSLGTAALYLALLAVTGRSRSPLFAFAFPLTMILPLIMGELIRAAVASSAVLLVGAWAMMLLDGASASEQLGWGHAGVVALAIACLLALADLRTRRASEVLALARERDLARLAESERLAATGRMAAEVAHEVNNPLAAARASATFVREQLSAGDWEVREASDDLVSSLDRIAHLVRRLARNAGIEPRPREPNGS